MAWKAWTILVLALWATPPATFAQPTNATVSAAPVKFRDVLNLSPEEARKHHPVQTRALITLSSPDYQLLYFQDETAGIFAYERIPSRSLKAGQLVEVDAVTARGKFAPILNVKTLRMVGEGRLPFPRKVSLSEFNDGTCDSQWVEIEGVVRAQSSAGQPLRLDLGSGRERVSVWVLQAVTNHPSLVDCRVRVRGVGGVQFNKSDLPAGFLLYVATTNEVTVESWPERAVFDRPIISSRDLSSYALRRVADHRVHLRGTVTRVSSTRKLCLRDDTGIVHLQLAEPMSLRSGEQFDVAGYFAAGGETPTLQEVVVRSLGPTTNRPAAGHLIDAADAATHAHELVALEGLLVQRSHSLKDVATLLLDTGGSLFIACLPEAEAGAFADMAVGARLRVTGVAEVDRAADSSRPLLTVWLRSPSDVQVVAPPARQLPGRTALALILPSLAVCGGLVWLLVAARRRWRNIRRELEESKRHLQDSLAARERMTQDLHDNVLQSVFAVGLGIEDCRRHLRTAPDKAEERLGAAINTLNRSLHDIRRSIGGLEPQTIGGHEFKAALKSLALTIGDGAGQFEIEVHPAATNQLTADQATQLLNVAKEAMSNSLRHARARTMRVALQPENGHIRLVIADDGAGFDPAMRSHTVGRGLRNMEQRARALGARLGIVSSPGAGTTITVDLPHAMP